ncbi:hypothetical protein [Streptomyces sp. H39-S7]|uniref:hypothetical protein n=1 Tax=Streptomyces sp. H39-S7 TaxID=3004357 RepID=UPI0022AE8991|nr:hypothetical protein [Streptomyces sp. H39-S7]MCZ4125450.1 hypothetical protein [Streptomyces sp. H39-S7]
MTKRFDNAALVLGAAPGRAAALCRFVGHPDAADSLATLEVVQAVLDFAEQLPDVDDVGEFMGLWYLAHSWGHPVTDVPGLRIELPEVSLANTAVAGHLQGLLENLAPEQLRELGIALSISQDMVALVLELMETTESPREFKVTSMHQMHVETALNDDRIGDHVDALLLDAPGEWPAPQRAALVLALVWDVADLVAQIAQLSVLKSLPTPLLWQHLGADHACTSTRVPDTDLLAWARIEPEEVEGRPLWSQARQPERFHWSVGWTDSEGQRLWFKGGRTGSLAAARWNAERVAQALLANRHRVTSPQNGDPLIVPA